MVKSSVNTKVYLTGFEVSDAELASVKLKPHDFHVEWNYTANGDKLVVFLFVNSLCPSCLCGKFFLTTKAQRAQGSPYEQNGNLMPFIV